jgi:Flp pilus assembly protein TadG
MIATRILDRPWAQLSAIRLGQRERALAFALLVVASAWWALTGYQRLNDVKAAAAESAIRLQQLREGKGDARRADYRRAVHREAVSVIDRSLDDPTIFLAQMRAQSQLQDFAIAAGMSAVQIGLDPVKASAAPLQQVSLTVESEFNWRSLLAFLGSLESSRTSYFVNAVDVAGVAPQQRVRVTVYVPYAAPGGPQ